MANYNSTHTGAEVDAAVTKANALPSATEINNKLAKALLTPSVTLQSNELVGVGTNGEQIRVQLGDGVTLEGTTSPYTLKATGGGGGGNYIHIIRLIRAGSSSGNITIMVISKRETAFESDTLGMFFYNTDYHALVSGFYHDSSVTLLLVEATKGSNARSIIFSAYSTAANVPTTLTVDLSSFAITDTVTPL